MVNRGSLLEPKSVKSQQLALRGAAEGCTHPWFQCCRGVERTRLTVRSDSTQNVGSSSSLKLALSALCLLQPGFNFRHFPNTRSLTGISSDLLALNKRDRKGLKEATPQRPSLVIVAGSIWLRCRLFSCGYLSSSSAVFPARLQHTGRAGSYARLILHRPARSRCCQALRKYYGGRSDVKSKRSAEAILEFGDK